LRRLALREGGHEVLINTRHSPLEFGKVLIARSRKGRVRAFQLKGDPGGRLTLKKFRDIKSQLASSSRRLWQLYREIMAPGDHQRLSAVVRRVPRFVLSYELCPEVEELYSWASINPVETCYTTAKTRGAPTRGRRREVVVVPGVR